jgi:pyridoxamine 5'-phosphate oxidase
MVMKNISDIRIEYSKKSLDLSDVIPDPINQFRDWFNQALTNEVVEPNAMTLATATATGTPSVRIVLLKGVEDNGFVFFTNYKSQKGQELAANPNAALNFYWPEQERQIAIAGSVKKISAEASEEYFSSRPRSSQIGAWTSPQSQKIDSRKILEENQNEIERKFEKRDVPRPTHWGGYILEPNRIEFWQGRESRLHDRILYEKENGQWTISRLAP